MNVLNWNEFLAPYEQVVDELCLKFRNLDREFKRQGQHSPIEYVESRVKRIASILEKANRKNASYTEEEIAEHIEDIAGIRIICRFVDDIDAVISLLRERDGQDLTILSEKDYITNRKPSGYRSFHILVNYPIMTIKGKKEVVAEIQVRTMAMNFWATIEHSIKYKYSGNLPVELQKRLISAAEASFQLDREMGTIRGDILEAQKIVQIKSDLVDQILDSIQKLYFTAKIEKINDLNKQFFELYSEGNVDKLSAFNQQLKVMAQIYKVQFV